VARAGGAGGRRDGEKIARALVSVNTPTGISHNGLPVDEISFGMAVFGAALAHL
jgi:hypothetical protein